MNETTDSPLIPVWDELGIPVDEDAEAPDSEVPHTATPKEVEDGG